MRNRYTESEDDFEEGWDNESYAGDEDFERDDPLEQDQDDDPGEELATEACGSCGRELIADIVQCPHCGEFAPTSGTVRKRRGWWWIAWVAATTAFLVGGWMCFRVLRTALRGIWSD